MNWVALSELELVFGVSSRRLQLVATRLLNRGSPWRRAPRMVVRQAPGQGGRAGLRYEVLVSSLPAELQDRLRQAHAGTPATLRNDADADAERAWRFHIIGPALARVRGKDRAKAIRDIAARTHLTPDGRTIAVSERSLHRWLKSFEQHGLAGLQKHARADRGGRRVLISRLWDNATPFDMAMREAIAARTTEHIRSLWRTGAVLSMVIRMGSEGLMKATQHAGFDPGQRKLRRICELPRRFVEPHMHLRKVHRFERDRKAHEDAKPRIRRTLAGVLPMEIVVGDVHHLDIYVRRDDGSLATPKMIAWLDFGTRRVFATFVLCSKGEGVRNEHVIDSFIAMVKIWGMPRTLYLDNGSEYNFAAFIDDALKLVAEDGLHQVRASQVVRAKPYNAPAKTIEGIFGLLERNYFSQLPGWIGGDRLKAKTANVGRAPVPFNGSMVELEQVLRAHLTIYESQPQSGELSGRSPRDVFEAAVASGWQRTDIDPLALRVAFSVEESRVVRQGAIEVKGQRWTCRKLHAYLGDRVSVLIPKYEDWSSLPLKDDQGRLFAMAELDVAFHPLDPEGAREAERRSRRYEKAIRNAARATSRRDLVGEAIAAAARVPLPPVPPSAGIVKLRPGDAEIGRALVEKPKQRLARQQAANAADQKEQLEHSARSLEAARAASRKAG